MDKINELNNSTILTTNIKNAVDDFSIIKLYHSYPITNFNKLINNNTQRKKNLRKKYDCLLESDIPFFENLFCGIRNYYYSLSSKCNKFINGGVYIEYLPSRAKKTKKLFIICIRCETDVKSCYDIHRYLSLWGFPVKIENNST